MTHSGFDDCGLVITAAGSGRRFGGFKQLENLGGQPILVRTAEAFSRCNFAARAVVLPSGLIADGVWSSLQSSHPVLENFTPVAGKSERALSVLEGLKALVEFNCQYVVVHDGVRPFPPIGVMVQCLEHLKVAPTVSAAIVGSAVTDTIKQVDIDPRISCTIPREQLRRAETPQVARFSDLMLALNLETSASARDEAQALELSGKTTAIFTHRGWNPKITTKDDLVLAEAYLNSLTNEEAKK